MKTTEPQGMYWCNTHQREATHIQESGMDKGKHHCSPNLGGICMVCIVVWIDCLITGCQKESEVKTAQRKDSCCQKPATLS